MAGSGRLASKVAVVTGGGNGIGRATVLRFLAEGARGVVVADLNETTGGETLALADRQGDGGRARFLRTDVAQEPDVAAAVDLAVREFGRLDCIFNNAGIAGAFGPIDQVGVEDWDQTFAVLVRGVFAGTKHATRVFKQQGQGGVILNTASVAGLAGGDGPQAYSAAKAAVVNFTRAVAIELAPFRIRAVAICPGGINTPLLHRGDPASMGQMLDRLQPWPEHGRPEDIAAAALYLASDEARFVTGTALVVDGGLTAGGGNSMRSLGHAEVMLATGGMDFGTTGLDVRVRTIP
jgi:NAD(P)-dependent dehydrogenase (short-subunit alcohol dehydrogenase family)